MDEHKSSDERSLAAAIAERFLDEPNADPDDDIRVLARQFNRSQEQLATLAAAVARYGKHERDCYIAGYGPKNCACGLQTAQETARVITEACDAVRKAIRESMQS
jgi:hypothetical protein